MALLSLKGLSIQILRMNLIASFNPLSQSGQSLKIRGRKTQEQITFYAWFCKYHAEEIKSTMIQSVREAAGLGDPSSEFCTNDSKAINSALKQFLAFKKSDWPIFNEKIRKFASSQEEVCNSITYLGQYSLREEYQHLSVVPS